MLFRLKQVSNLYRLIPAYIIVILQKTERKELIIDEILHWKKCANINQTRLFDILTALLLDFPEYRNLLQYRLRFSGGGLISRAIVQFLFPKLFNLFISTWEEIGPRLFIQHGFSTMISAKRIGSDCHINQQVTIGFTRKNEPPVIGNNATISCGAKVLGQINVGDNVIIGANAVVVKDVESNLVVGGVPAHVIRRID